MVNIYYRTVALYWHGLYDAHVSPMWGHQGSPKHDVYARKTSVHHISFGNGLNLGQIYLS
jgi:hypothetical protein